LVFFQNVGVNAAWETRHSWSLQLRPGIYFRLIPSRIVFQHHLMRERYTS